MDYVKIFPDDLLLFRDDTKMDRGMDKDTKTEAGANLIISKIFPYPSVFWGSIFTSFLRQGLLPEVLNILKIGDSEKKEVSDTCLSEYLSIRFLGIIIKKKIYVPAPLDLFYDESVVCAKFDGNTFSVPTKGKTKRAENMFIELEHFVEKYLSSNYNNIKLHPISSFIDFEHRTGIEIEDRRAKEGHLYRINFLRFQDPEAGYVVGYHTKINQSVKDGFFTLGGERKIAYMKQLSSIDKYITSYEKKLCSTDKIKLILISPLIVSEVDTESYIQKLLSKAICLEGLAVGSLEKFNGFDMAKGERKKYVWAIPAGSVLYLRSKEFQGKTYLNIQRLINEKFKKHTKFYRGFGLYLLAEW